MKAMDLMKAPGFGRKKPVVAKAILAASGELTTKETFRIQNFYIYEGNLSNFAESIKSFLVEFTA